MDKRAILIYIATAQMLLSMMATIIQTRKRKRKRCEPRDALQFEWQDTRAG